MNWKSAWEYYKDIRPNNLTTPKYKHVFLLLYWPIFGLVFMSLEHIVPIVYKKLLGRELIYTAVESAQDAAIPFCEWFVIPYYFWFVFLIGMVIYSLLFDIRAFRHYMWFVILSYSVTAIIYIVWPNMQPLRPMEFPRDNWMVDIVKNLYDFDTDTNVCPSIHVLGSLAVCFAGLHSKTLRHWGWKLFFVISTVLISLSTVFLKQHSIIDVYAALAVGAVCYVLVYFVICREKKTGKGIPQENQLFPNT
ncbi:MAG: phosphatase PAP2 family protein [Clostridia bacterium]|nr:phosphatase PAP2 family protein [Clostridia bacterium]